MIWRWNHGDGDFDSFLIADGSQIEIPNPPAGTTPPGLEFYVWLEDTQNRTPEEMHITSYIRSSSESSDIWAPLYSYTVSGNVSFTARYKAIEISLTDNDNNGEVIYKNNGKFVKNVTLSGRTLYKDGTWNTLCLPFDISISDSPLAGDGVEARILSDASFDNGTLTLNFSNPVTQLVAGTPYIIKWSSGTNMVDPVFHNVTITTSVNNSESSNEYVDFIGIFSPETIYQNVNSTDEEGNQIDAATITEAENKERAESRTRLYLGADNKLYYPTTPGFTINACRAYFRLKNGLLAGPVSTESGTTVNGFSLNFSGEPTGIMEVKTPSASQGWYTLDGRRLTGQPTTSGVYIRNGKKQVVK